MKNKNRILPVILCMVLVMGIIFVCEKIFDSKSPSKTTENSAVSVDISGADGYNAPADSDKPDGTGTSDSKVSSDKDTSDGGSGAESDESKSTGNGNDGNVGNGGSNGNGGDTSVNAGSNGSSGDDKNASGNNDGSESKASNGGGNASSSSNSDSGGNSAKPNNSTADKNSSKGSSDNSTADSKGDKPAVVDGKSFVITVYKKSAPETCKNFDKLVKEGFYNGLRFYRVIENFLAETGDPNCDGTGGSKDKIKGEFMANGFDNRLSHTRGMVSMNRSPSDPNSANSRFFICYNDNCSFMDGNYAAFGKVTEGMDIVDDFTSIEVVKGADGTKSLPVTPITITKAEYIGNDKDGNAQYRFYVTY